MAAPSYVPVDPRQHPRDYEAPARRGNAWRATRPGELIGSAMPEGGLYGNQGPDIGYAHKLVHQISEKIIVGAGESTHDAEAGVVAVAMRRASLNGRAPIVADLEVALTIWGFADAQPASGLRVMRSELFEGCAMPKHGYEQRREIANAVSQSALEMTPDAVRAAHAHDWASLFSER